MKILYISKTSIKKGGGSEKKAEVLTKKLASRGHDVTVVCGKTSTNLSKKVRDNNHTIRHVKCVPDIILKQPIVGFYLPRYLFPLISLPILLLLMFQRSFDVIIEDQTPFPMFGIILKILFKTPVVAVQHEYFDCSCYEVYDPVTASIQLLLQNFLRVFDYAAVIVPSTHVKKQFINYGIPEDRLYTIVNGIYRENYHTESTNKNPGHLIVLGRITKRKGQSAVIKAVSQLVERGYDIHLHVVGDGPYKGKIIELVDELGIESNVTIHGYVNEDKKIELLNLSEIFMFASRQEGLGNVLLEAMAAECAIVARYLPVYMDFFQNGVNGTLIRDPNAKDLAKEAELLLCDRDRLKSIQTQNKSKVKEYTWESYTDKAESVLEQINERVQH